MSQKQQTTHRHNLEQYFDFDGRHDYGSNLIIKELTINKLSLSPFTGRIHVEDRYFFTYGEKQWEASKLLEIGKTYLFVYPDHSYYKRVLCIFDVC
jgi:hypothetical protein